MMSFTTNKVSLHELAKAQLEEHKEWLRKAVRRHYLSDLVSGDRRDEIAEVSRLFEWIDEIRLHSVKPEEQVDLQGKAQASVTYEYPDAFYEFVSGPKSPEELKMTLAGGHLVPTDGEVR